MAVTCWIYLLLVSIVIIIPWAYVTMYFLVCHYVIIKHVVYFKQSFFNSSTPSRCMCHDGQHCAKRRNIIITDIPSMRICLETKFDDSLIIPN